MTLEEAEKRAKAHTPAIERRLKRTLKIKAPKGVDGGLMAGPGPVAFEGHKEF